MSKIFKNLIPYWRWIIVIFVFLFAQAYCDLALPEYTSNIIDVGIQNHGIEHILPIDITEEDYQTAQTFMLEDEKEKFADCYSDETESQDNIDGGNEADSTGETVGKSYKLIADEDTLDKMDEELIVPIVMAYQVFQSGQEMDVDASAIPQGVELTDDIVDQIRSGVQDKIDAVGSSTLKSINSVREYLPIDCNLSPAKSFNCNLSSIFSILALFLSLHSIFGHIADLSVKINSVPQHGQFLGNSSIGLVFGLLGSISGFVTYGITSLV